MTTVALNAWAFVAEYEKRVVRGVRKAIPVLMEELKRLTPEDTKNMLSSYRIESLKFEDGNIVWTITNDADYAIYVEYWANWLRFNYHKPKWSTFYTWVWNMTFHRAVDNTRNQITLIIYNEVNR